MSESATERPATKQITGHLEWVCMVVRSGSHNGSHCRPWSPHDNWWDCGWYYCGLERAGEPDIDSR